MFDLTIIKKDLYKSKVNANFSHYCAGNLYYNVMIGGFDEMDGPSDTEYLETIKLSSDLGTTSFGAEIKASELNRWIAKAF